MTNKIDIKELDFLQDDLGIWYYTLNNVPYTGCAYQIYPNNVQASENNFLNGYKEGIQKQWYQNGQLLIVQSFLNNVPNGKCLEWHENGVLRFEAEYDRGEKLWSKSYNEKGELIKQYPLDKK
jgi:antitoxin component YwqK of YwqJK toxin-antitoxin module